MKRVLILSITAVLGFACTKELPYEETHKDQVITKSLIDTNADYIYVPTMASASRTSKAARPYWMGNQKIVRLQFTEKTLQFLEVDSEERFRGNSSNSKLVFEVPIEHLEYRCAKDRYNECTNTEEVDHELHWPQRSRFKPNFASTNFAEISVLPIEMDNFFKSSCYREESSRLVDYEVTNDAINFQIERTYNASLSCLKLSDFRSLSDITTTAVFHYSVVKLNTLASSDYRVAHYPQEDENTFGFFSTEIKKMNVDNSFTKSSEHSLLNRWNPEKKEIVYYLSDEFKKPEHSLLKKSTEEAFDQINSGLKTAGASIQLVLKDPAGKKPGDIRNSMIVMVEDPVAASVIGYGPSVINPLTGEILSARTVMYYGTILRTAKYSYEEVRETLRSRPKANFKGLKLPLGLSSTAPENDKILSAAAKSIFKGKTAHPAKTVKSALVNKDLSIKNAILELTQYHRHTNTEHSKEEIFLAKNNSCVLGAEMPTINTLVEDGLVKAFGQDLKPWEELSEKEKQVALNIIVPESWKGTLIHELGHNLGLRHNFGASEDKDNFYSESELKTMGIKHRVPYSSVMDYGASELNVLPTLGKYDIAALQFGYARKVESQGKLVNVETTLKDLQKENIEVKAYRYCTDEHADVNAGCKRFDEGTTYTEIAQSMIKTYKSHYRFRNFRNDALDFSLMSDERYAGIIDNSFYNLRLFLEVYERINNAFTISEEEWKKDEFLSDLRSAAVLSGKFFIDVITTPDIMCAFSKRDTPNEIIAVDLMTNINSNAANCSELSLKPEFMVVGEAGKSLHSRKSALSNNPYADQIDVRGIWIDKVLATKYLFARTLEKEGSRSFDAIQDSYFDMEELRKEMLQLLQGFIFNNVSRPVKFTLINGQELEETLPVEVFKSHQIAKHFSPELTKTLNLPDRDFYFIEVMLNEVAQQKERTLAKKDIAKALVDFVGIHRSKAVNEGGKVRDSIKSIDLGDKYLAAIPARNPIANQMIDFLISSNLLSQLEPEKVKQIFLSQSKKEGLPETASDLEKAAYSLDPRIVKLYLEGRIHSPDYYLTILELLPSL